MPWTNKNLSVKWGGSSSKLEPGQKETYTAIVTGPDAAKAVAEMVAGMYDASLMPTCHTAGWIASAGSARTVHGST
ncbi:MAG: hypothetical protein U0792_11635 [Gemmataceae bacterium]